MSGLGKALASAFKRRKMKKAIRKTTGQKEPYKRPEGGKEVKESKDDKIRKMVEEANKARKKKKK